MPAPQADSAERLVVTAGELAHLQTAALSPPPFRPPPYTIGWWNILVGSILMFCLPLLCVAAIGVRLAFRDRPAEVKAAWAKLLCTQLIISGLLTSLLLGCYLYFARVQVSEPESNLTPGLISHDLAASFPSLPSASPMTAVEIAEKAKLLVFIVTPDSGSSLRNTNLENSSIGAGTLLMANDAGYLVATNRHVVDLHEPLLKGVTDRVLVVSNQGSYAYADVVGRHQKLDLALLWIARHGNGPAFRQPIARYANIAVGSSVFVIGHPQRLFFTLSSGLVSRAGGDSIVQLSAPVSPGNSGGPAYDNLGNLLGIVTYVIDKQANPNAENLNFATAADAFLTENGWGFYSNGKAALKSFLEK